MSQGIGSNFSFTGQGRNGREIHDTEPEVPVVQQSEPEKAPFGTVDIFVLVIALIGAIIIAAMNR